MLSPPIALISSQGAGGGPVGKDNAAPLPGAAASANTQGSAVSGAQRNILKRLRRGFVLPVLCCLGGMV